MIILCDGPTAHVKPIQVAATLIQIMVVTGHASEAASNHRPDMQRPSSILVSYSNDTMDRRETMQRVRTCLIAAAAAATLMLSGPLAAQAPSAKPDEHTGHHPQGTAPPPAPAKGPGMGMMGGQPGMMHDMMMQSMSAAHLPHMMLHHTEGYLAFLRTELQITAEQASLWTTFADAARQAVKKLRDQAPTAGRPGPAPAWPDRLADQEKKLSVQLDALRTVRPAASALYAGLTPEQRKKADELTSAGMGMRM
jgi:hypothetical protein